jgi:hypothetical protein
LLVSKVSGNKQLPRLLGVEQVAYFESKLARCVFEGFGICPTNGHEGFGAFLSTPTSDVRHTQNLVPASQLLSIPHLAFRVAGLCNTHVALRLPVRTWQIEG